jgi:hypothetical protein
VLIVDDAAGRIGPIGYGVSVVAPSTSKFSGHSQLQNRKWLSLYLWHGEAAKAHLLTAVPVAVRLRFQRCNLK